MILLLGAIAIPLFLTLLYLYMLKPNTGRGGQMRVFQEKYIAHRGLFDNQSDAPENSMAAFRKAVEQGYGIELDVQMTADKKLVVFHDEWMSRMCGVSMRVVDSLLEEIRQYTLAESEEKVPLFRDVLDLVDGRVPLIIEVKPDGDYIGAVKMVCEYLADYKGSYCIESFHPAVVRWLWKNKPEIIRGQLSSDFIRKPVDKNLIGRFFMANMLINFYGKPDFIAYNYKLADQFSYRLLRKLYPVINAAWTVRSQKGLVQARRDFSVIIFDSFVPDEIQI